MVSNRCELVSWRYHFIALNQGTTNLVLMPPITGWPTVNFNCPAQRENMPNCNARWGPMGPMGPDCAVPPAKCVIIHVAPLIIMCVQTAFGNSHTHTYTYRQTHLLARSLISWTISSILLWRQFHQVSTPDGVNKRPWGLVAREISVYICIIMMLHGWRPDHTQGRLG